MTASSLFAIPCCFPGRAVRPVCRLSLGDRRSASDRVTSLARQPIGGDGAVEGRAGERFVCHGRDDAASAVGRLGVANALATPGAVLTANLFLQAVVENGRQDSLLVLKGRATGRTVQPFSQFAYGAGVSS